MLQWIGKLIGYLYMYSRLSEVLQLMRDTFLKCMFAEHMELCDCLFNTIISFIFSEKKEDNIVPITEPFFCMIVI